MKPDLSKCQCDKPGWCPIFGKEMGTNPPNWQWCQDCSQEERETYHDRNNCQPHRLRSLHDAVVNGRTELIEFIDNLPSKNSDYAVCVIPANELAMELLSVTRSSIKRYADKCGADYIELRGDQHPNWPMANKYRLHKVTTAYKKTLYLDVDVLVRHTAPNIFEITPDDKISAYDEFKSWQIREDTHWIQRQHEVIIHKVCDKETQGRLMNNGEFRADSMINGGVMVIPQSCADYYQQPPKEYPNYWCFDQSYLTLTLPKEKFNPLDEKWNLEYVDSDSFWYFLPDAHFIHVNSLRDYPGFRKHILRQIDAGDLTQCERDRYIWYEKGFPKTVEKMTKPHDEKVVTKTFKDNKIGIVFNNLTPGGATTWLESFVQCFKKDITGIFACEDHPEYNDLTLGLTRGFNLDELYELYVKSDIMLYWLYSVPTNMEYFPDFIWKNPLKKKVIFMSHSSLRVNSHDLLIEMLNPDEKVFVNKEAAQFYQGRCIPPVVEQIPGLQRKPIPKNILWHHRLERNKGVEVLSEIREILPDFTFHICGSWIREIHDGKTIGFVEDSLIHSCRDNVFYYGHVDDMKPLFESCSVSLSTSFDESFGLSVAESIINGVPSVSHATGIGNYSDFVVPYCAHASEWAKAIRLCDAMVETARNQEYFMERFSMEQFERAWRQIL